MSMTHVICPRCLGDGEEPGVPWDDELGKPLCSLCEGNGEVSPAIAEEYQEEDRFCGALADAVGHGQIKDLENGFAAQFTRLRLGGSHV